MLNQPRKDGVCILQLHATKLDVGTSGDICTAISTIGLDAAAKEPKLCGVEFAIWSLCTARSEKMKARL